VQFVLNYEEGGENNPLHGDPTSETFLSELVTAQAYENRHMSMESMYEYGSRVGVWRILREFEQRGLPLTVFGVAWRWSATPNWWRLHGARRRDRQPRPALDPLPAHARGHRARAHRAWPASCCKKLTGGAWPAGWYTGRDSPNTRRLVVDQGGYEYDSDYYGDDLPFWLQVQKTDGSWRRTWWCPTRWTPTTCASCRRRASTPATTSSPTCATPSTRCTPKATPAGLDPEDDEHRHALPAAGQAGAHRLAAALPGPHRPRTSACGSAAASTSRGTGSRCTRSTLPPPSPIVA
jgi:peptidoglycan/xylan/chitin deacetylase (PgdA/CDA1 family)